MGMMDFVREKMKQRQYEKENAGWVAEQRLKDLKAQHATAKLQEAVRKEKQAVRETKMAKYREFGAKVSKVLKKAKERRGSKENKIMRGQIGTTSKDHFVIQKGGGVMGADVSNPDWLKRK